MERDPLEPLRRAFRDVPACRIATVGGNGHPHVASRWFVWTEPGLFVATPRGDATWENLEADPRLSVVVDRGRSWMELAGVRIDGTGELSPVEHPDMRGPMSAWHEKYRGAVAGEGFEQLARDVPALGFVRVLTTAVRTWDHARAPDVVRGNEPL
ncbi:MAG: pyridoxamine 5'-phosphate oxidase family protein [Actinomycetota bacterium]